MWSWFLWIWSIALLLLAITMFGHDSPTYMSQDGSILILMSMSVSYVSTAIWLLEKRIKKLEKKLQATEPTSASRDVGQF